MRRATPLRWGLPALAFGAVLGLRWLVARQTSGGGDGAGASSVVCVAEGAIVKPLGGSIVELAGRGTFDATHLPTAETLKVRAGKDVIAASGARFRADADAEGIAAIDVVEGAVRLSTRGEVITVSAGERWRRSRDASPAPLPTCSDEGPEGPPTR